MKPEKNSNEIEKNDKKIRTKPEKNLNEFETNDKKIQMKSKKATKKY